MNAILPQFDVRIARDQRDLRGAQRLRYSVFVEELGGDGDLVDHDERIERDRYDPFFDHLVLIDKNIDPDTHDHVVGAYRLMLGERAAAAGGFYSSHEYDLSVLLASGRKLLEVGRTCIHPAYRGGTTLFHLWNGMFGYGIENGVDILFGVASFHGTDLDTLSPSLSLLHHRHLAPPDLRVRALPQDSVDHALLCESSINRTEAMLNTPALIKAYIRLGGFIGDGYYVDHEFNTTDVCLVLDRDRMTERQKTIYIRGLDR